MPLFSDGHITIVWSGFQKKLYGYDVSFYREFKISNFYLPKGKSPGQNVIPP